MPGPGNYNETANTFGKNLKGTANMGSKYKPVKNLNPGPGQYSQEDGLTRKQGNNVKISQA